MFGCSLSLVGVLLLWSSVTDNLCAVALLLVLVVVVVLVVVLILVPFPKPLSPLACLVPVRAAPGPGFHASNTAPKLCSNNSPIVLPVRSIRFCPVWAFVVLAPNPLEVSSGCLRRSSVLVITSYSTCSYSMRTNFHAFAGLGVGRVFFD